MFNGLKVIEHDPDAGCEECPFAEWHEAAWSYKCVRLGAWVYDGKDSAPDTCPIRDGAIMVSGDHSMTVENLRQDAVMEGERRVDSVERRLMRAREALGSVIADLDNAIERMDDMGRASVADVMRPILRRAVASANHADEE